MNHGKQTLESMSQAVWYNQWTLNKFSGFLKGDILEVGCGIGNFTKDLKKLGKVWAIDVEKDYIHQVKGLNDQDISVGLGNIETGEYFFGEKKFDSVICLNVLEHIEDDKKALDNIYSLLKPNGYLILLVPTHKFLYGEIDKSIGHFRRYERKEITGLLKNNFSLISIRVINFLGALGWWFSGKILKETTVDEKKLSIYNKIAPTFLSLENMFGPPMGTSLLIIARKTNS